jgi:methylated-DNA-[protein]-cysteine S-methyltransferase
MVVETPIGPLALTASPRGLLRVDWEGRGGGDARMLERTAEQLLEYFAGRRTRFELPLDLAGTEFQRLAWMALADIPYGTTRSYAEQALQIGRPTAIRAVGAANGRNPLPIVLPCHRLVGSNGSLTGFGGGLWRKRALLDLEAALSPG